MLSKNTYPHGRIRKDYYHVYRKANNKPKSKLIEAIGFLDDLEKDFENPLAHVKAEAS